MRQFGFMVIPPFYTKFNVSIQDGFAEPTYKKPVDIQGIAMTTTRPTRSARM